MRKVKININPKIFNKTFIPLLNNTSRFIIMKGGASSGKSVFLSQRYIIKNMENRERNILVVRKTAKSNRNSTFALFKQMINKFGLRKYYLINKTDMTITNRLHGNQIVFSGLDDIEKLKSITFETGILTDIWMEEATEAELEEFEQLNLRLRGDSTVPFQMCLSFNPVSKKNWIYKRFFEEPDERALIHHSTYLDNKFRGPDLDLNMEMLKSKLIEYYNVYALGEWGELTEGLIFKRQFYSTYKAIPADAKGIIYCDPNLSKKGKGDTTGIVKLLYSPSTGKYYVAPDAVCHSMSQSEEIIEILVRMRQDDRCRAIGMDGNVNQESHWSDHIRNYFRAAGTPPPIVEYKKYRVDELAKNAEWAWNNGDILFPEGFQNTMDGEAAINQLFTFAGKKNKTYRTVNGRRIENKDDFPDALICAVEFLYERGFVRKRPISETTINLLINKR